jgi:hypothetical protein
MTRRTICPVSIQNTFLKSLGSEKIIVFILQQYENVYNIYIHPNIL